jgi:Mrp family chromosome partitioning ATPase
MTPGRSHTLLLTTPAAYPDKSLALTNIAITAAQNGYPTILVDADRDATDLQPRLGLGEYPGLSDLLLMEDVITPQKIAPHLQKTSIPGLALLSRGSKIQQTQNMSRPLKLSSIIESLDQLLRSDVRPEGQTGLIIFNSLPVLLGVDAATISTLVDQTFLLIVAGQTTRSQARKAYEQLERVHANVAGLVLLQS